MTPSTGLPMIALVACSATKLDRRAPARELYTSPLFRKSLAQAAAWRCDPIYVISALHGLVGLDDELAPYDSKLGRRSKRERQHWARVIAGTLIARHGRDAFYVLLAGEEYVRPIAAALTTYDGMRDGPDGYQWRGVARELILEPLKGMQIGERLAFLGAA